MDFDEEMQKLSELTAKSRRISVPRNDKFNRGEVVRAFQSAFDMIGGVPRLALWANQNPSEFFKLYSKLLPASTITTLVSGDNSDLRRMSQDELERIVNEQDSESMDSESMDGQYVRLQ